MKNPNSSLKDPEVEESTYAHFRKHSFEYVTPSLPQTGSYNRGQYDVHDTVKQIKNVRYAITEKTGLKDYKFGFCSVS